MYFPATDEEKRRFVLAKEACRTESPEGGIGTLSERTLHAVLKRFYEPETSHREQKIGPYVADIFTGEAVIEIQTHNLYALQNKLAAYKKAGYPVTVVYPVAAVKRARRICPDKSETERLVSRKGDFRQAFRELYGARMLLQEENVRFELLYLDICEVRRGREKIDRVPQELLGKLILQTRADYASLLPDTLPPVFTAAQLCAALKVPQRQKSFAPLVFVSSGVITPCGKLGKAILYQIRKEE